jgi:hypothetical protein
MAQNESGQANFHENLKHESEIKIGSNRAFGLVMAAACFVIASFGFWAATSRWPYWLAGAIAFALLAWMRPAVLSPLNRLWFRLGLLMHRVVNPLIMALLFFVVITPMGLLMRACGKRPLELKFQRGAPSYWIARDRGELRPRHMADQY